MNRACTACNVCLPLKPRDVFTHPQRQLLCLPRWMKWTLKFQIAILRSRYIAHRAPVAKTYRKIQRLRSEEHTSELQSRLHLVCRLLLEKKKNSVDPVHRI